MLERFELTVSEDERRVRLEDLLFARFTGLSRMYLRDTIREGRCEVNGLIENRGRRLRPGDFIEVEIDPTRENAMRPQKLPLDIVFEDALLLVLNKAA